MMNRILTVLVLGAALFMWGCPGNGPEGLYSTAELEEKQHNPEHAQELYREIIKKYPESDYARRAAERLKALEGPPVPPVDSVGSGDSVVPVGPGAPVGRGQ